MRITVNRIRLKPERRKRGWLKQTASVAWASWQAAAIIFCAPRPSWLATILQKSSSRSSGKRFPTSGFPGWRPPATPGAKSSIGQPLAVALGRLWWRPAINGRFWPQQAADMTTQSYCIDEAPG